MKQIIQVRMLDNQFLVMDPNDGWEAFAFGIASRWSTYSNGITANEPTLIVEFKNILITSLQPLMYQLN